MSLNTFIFQSMPDRFDLRTELMVGHKDTWYATRYRNEMKMGDIVYFWMGGKDEFRGIYGWGKIVSEPYIKKSWDSYGIDVEYIHKFSHHISSAKLKQNNILKELLILKVPIGTNFIISETQNKELAELIKNFGEKIPVY